MKSNQKGNHLYAYKDTIRRLFLLTLFSFLIVESYAQNKTISGTVTDFTGEPVIGASVLVNGTTNGTITDLNGKFSLSNVPIKGTITITYIGYKKQEVSVAGNTNFKITLQEDTETLDEVVVVGYGVQKKSDVTGAMARVGEKELKAMPVRNALEGMQGKTAGVDITSSQRPGVMLYDAKLSQIYAARMQEEGIYVTGFYYPVVPKDQARIRVQISAGHEKAHLDKCIAAFIKVGKELNVLKAE